jgi:hypothetical protein
MNTKYEFEPHECEETGVWYCRKLVYMSSPEQYGEFESEWRCQISCNALNQIDSNIELLKKFYNIKLEVREVK